jgi:hypothetical protein
VNPVGVYLDEDVQSAAFIASLRSRGLKVLTTTEAGMTSARDEAQLEFATSQNLVLVSGNAADFARLHQQWSVAGRDHAGIILISRQKWSPGELARRVLRLFAGVSGRDLRGRLEFISNW